jgi:hypothetical protein
VNKSGLALSPHDSAAFGRRFRLCPAASLKSISSLRSSAVSGTGLTYSGEWPGYIEPQASDGAGLRDDHRLRVPAAGTIKVSTARARARFFFLW